MLSTLPESWTVTKPAVSTSGGIVSSQHILASQIGAQILARGGNAVDAAVAAGLAIGAVEPWMSGIGGCGYMVVYLAHEHRSYAVEFGVKSSTSLDPADYPLIEGTGPDLFTWPSVAQDRNIRGPLSVAVPGMVAGLDRALGAFGRFDWRDVLAPATRLAEQGMQVDWYGTLKIASAAAELAEFDHSRRVFLPHGFVPVGEWAGPLPSIRLGELARTFRRLADAGAADFYRGEIAGAIVDDARDLGIRLTAEDLAAYRPHLSEVERGRYRGSEIDIVPGLTAGPTLKYALASLADNLDADESMPDAAAFAAYARSLYDAYDHRLAFIGDVPDTSSPSCTTHINVADRDGNLAALTITLLSLFGSKLTLPRTGILMNNGVMWFDPRPNRPNSIAPGKRPLSNMCPVVLLRDDGQRFALGASGGRRIVPAVFQLISFLTDYRMSIDEAIHLPRLDVSGSETVTLDSRLPPDVVEAVSSAHRTRIMPNGVYPNLFACPSVVGHDPASRTNTGAAFVVSPVAAAVPETG
jgi:gamma-glutamyltranspeptidase/glutathione hydrolase